MARSQPRPKQKGFQRGPRAFAGELPAASVLFGSLLALLPVMSERGWWPDFGFVMLLAWRMHRSDPFPNWWAIPLGLANDLIVGHPLGLSVFTFCFALFVIDLLDARRMGKNYVAEWLIAGFLLVFAEIMQWWIAAIQGAAMPIEAIWPPIVITIFCFPVAAFLVAMLDRYRLRD